MEEKITGIIKAAASAVKGALSDSWLKTYEADEMDDQTIRPYKPQADSSCGTVNTGRFCQSCGKEHF